MREECKTHKNFESFVVKNAIPCIGQIVGIDSDGTIVEKRDYSKTFIVIKKCPECGLDVK